MHSRGYLGCPLLAGVVRSNDHMGSFDKNVMVYAVQGAHSWVYLGTCSNASSDY